MAKIKILTNDGVSALIGVIKKRIEKESYMAAGKSVNKLLSTDAFAEPGVGETAKGNFDTAISSIDTKLKALSTQLSIGQETGLIGILEAVLTKVSNINVPSFASVVTFDFDKDTQTSLTVKQVFGAAIQDSDAHKDDAISALPTESGKYTFYLIKNADGTYQTFFSKLPEQTSLESLSSSEVEGLVNDAFNN